MFADHDPALLAPDSGSVAAMVDERRRRPLVCRRAHCPAGQPL